MIPRITVWIQPADSCRTAASLPTQSASWENEMKRLVASAITLMMTAAIGTAAASPYDDGYRYEDGPYGRGDYDYARVVNVDPIVEVVNLPVRSERCHGGRDGYAYNDGYGYNGGYYNSGYN